MPRINTLVRQDSKKVGKFLGKGNRETEAGSEHNG